MIDLQGTVPDLLQSINHLFSWLTVSCLPGIPIDFVRGLVSLDDLISSLVLLSCQNSFIVGKIDIKPRYSVEMWSISLHICMLFMWIGGFSWSYAIAKDIDAFSELTDSHISAGGNSNCITGNIKLTVTTPNLQLNYKESSSQLAVTELIVELLQVNSTFMQQIVTSPHSITGTYNIYSSLCVPADATAARKVDTVQFLTHADTLSSLYWDIAPGYSYVDAVTAAGYAAFSYDRIGYGKSDHPDPIQVVQGPLHREIAHALVQLLQQKQNGRKKFAKVVGVGHAAGSVITQAVTAKYLKDFDAVILTGLSLLGAGTDLALAAFDLQIARQASERFRDLSSGYLTQANAIGVQFSFFRYPNFDPNS